MQLATAIRVNLQPCHIRRPADTPDHTRRTLRPRSEPHMPSSLVSRSRKLAVRRGGLLARIAGLPRPRAGWPVFAFLVSCSKAGKRVRIGGSFGNQPSAMRFAGREPRQSLTEPADLPPVHPKPASRLGGGDLALSRGICDHPCAARRRLGVDLPGLALSWRKRKQARQSVGIDPVAVAGGAVATGFAGRDRGMPFAQVCDVGIGEAESFAGLAGGQPVRAVILNGTAYARASARAGSAAIGGRSGIGLRRVGQRRVLLWLLREAERLPMSRSAGRPAAAAVMARPA